ncbi:MAG: glycosyltransferase [Alphaproteobacteria bacterium]|nr:glycosyltransferase [Alphaproteobacteria bacterium]
MAALKILQRGWRNFVPEGMRKRMAPLVRDRVNNVLARKVPPPAPLETIPQGPVTIAGYTQSVLGLGTAMRLYRDGLQACGYALREESLSAMIKLQDYGEAALPQKPAPAGGVLVLGVNPPEMGMAFSHLDPALVRSSYRIGFWAWETPEVPEAWMPRLRHFHELWVHSNFVRDAILARSAIPPIPVHVVPHPVPALDHVMPARARFDLPDHMKIVLTMFDLRSSMARKNPMAAIKAFRAAEPGTYGALLVIKVSHPEAAPEQFAALKALTAGDPRIRLMTDTLDQEAAYALIASCDIVLSLHRAEGFGLVLAEAMRLGKAVVATNWSGNVDFMNRACAELVDYRLVPVVDPQGQYRDGQWAEADVDDAARALRYLLKNEDQCAAMGRRASDHAARMFSRHAFAAHLSPAFLRFAAHEEGREDCAGAS